MAKQKQMKLTDDETSALIFGIGLLAGVGSTVAAFSQAWAYSLLTIVAALVILRFLHKQD
jgi:hypothetical protein